MLLLLLLLYLHIHESPSVRQKKKKNTMSVSVSGRYLQLKLHSVRPDLHRDSDSTTNTPHITHHTRQRFHLLYIIVAFNAPEEQTTAHIVNHSVCASASDLLLVPTEAVAPVPIFHHPKSTNIYSIPFQ